MGTSADQVYHGMSNSTIGASARGASLLIALQVASRGLTFALNQILLRFLSPELLGVAVQLDLYCISVLYFSRESLRVALQRHADGDRSLQAVVNLAYLALAAGVPISYLFAELYLHTELPIVPYLVRSLRLYSLAALVELLSEPGFVAAQQQLAYKTRAAAETSATVTKTLVTVGVVIWASQRQVDLGVLPFAIGQLAYAVSLLAVYLQRMSQTTRANRISLLPTRLVSSSKVEYLFSLFHRPLLTLSLSMSLQSVFKYLLTQGDSILITTFASLQEQGAYALASNYGGLIARMLFQPIEEASRTMFAKLCNNPINDSTNQLQDALSALTRILHLYALLSLFATSLGPWMASPALSLLAGSRWSTGNAKDVLALYTVYIPLMATNGVTEAFVSAVADKQQLATQSLAMAANFALGFALPTYILSHVWDYGAKGLVLANCINMALRIGFNLKFIVGFFRDKSAGRVEFDVGRCLPSGASVGAAVLISASLRATTGLLSSYGVLGELLRIGIMGVGLAVVVAWFERGFIRELYTDMRPAAVSTKTEQ